MWQQRWPQSSDLPSLYHQLMVMPVLASVQLAMNHDAPLTGRILSCGVYFTNYRRLLLIHGVWASVLELGRRASRKTQLERKSEYQFVLMFSLSNYFNGSVCLATCNFRHFCFLSNFFFFCSFSFRHLNYHASLMCNWFLLVSSGY